RIENLVFEKDSKPVADTDIVYLSVNDYRYNSVLAAKVFDKGEHEKFYDTSNDEISDVRDFIIDYIKNFKNGVIQRNVDNNWKLTGNAWDSKQREIAVKAINDNKVKIPTSEDGRTPNVRSVTWKEVKTALNGVDIITINDFHGSLKPEGKNIGAAKLVGEINRLKAQYPNTMVVAGGDLFQGSAMSNLLKGEPVAKMLKELNLEFSAIGNHEFDWGRDLIPQWAEQGNFKFLASNIYDKNTGEPVHWAEPYGIKEINGKTIGFIGLATPETAYKTKPDNVADLEFKDPLESTNYWANFLRQERNVDAVIVLSHLGALQDYNSGKITGEAADLAEQATGIDAIISAHTHRFVSGVVNNIPIIQGGYNGRGIAKLEILFDGNALNIIPSKDELYKRVNTLPEDANMKAIYEKYAQDLDPILNEVVVNVDTDLDHSRNIGVTPLGQFVTKYMAEVSNVQIGITNAGGLRKPLPAGNITVGDMWEVMPFDNTLVTMKLKGSDLKRVIEHGIMNEDIGWVQFHGLKVYYDSSKEYGNRITSMRLLDGTKVDMNKEYTVVTNDFMYAKGDNYDFTGATEVLDTGIAIRDALIDKLQPLGNVSFKFDDKTLVDGKEPVTNNEKPN
ncbi:MAG: 5'-nucleotidase C-terminal domain-containing protein, partial [Sarcina sp.]